MIFDGFWRFFGGVGTTSVMNGRRSFRGGIDWFWLFPVLLAGLFVRMTLPFLALPCLALPCLAFPCLASF